MVSNNLSCLPQSNTENQVHSHSPQMPVKLPAHDPPKVFLMVKQESGTIPVPPSTRGHKHLHSVHIQQTQAQQPSVSMLPLSCCGQLLRDHTHKPKQHNETSGCSAELNCSRF